MISRKYVKWNLVCFPGWVYVIDSWCDSLQSHLPTKGNPFLVSHSRLMVAKKNIWNSKLTSFLNNWGSLLDKGYPGVRNTALFSHKSVTIPFFIYSGSCGFCFYFCFSPSFNFHYESKWTSLVFSMLYILPTQRNLVQIVNNHTDNRKSKVWESISNPNDLLPKTATALMYL